MREADYSDMRRQVERALFEVVFAEPVRLAEEASPDHARILRLENAEQSPLEKSLRSGRVQYLDGVFSGEYSAPVAAEIKKLGGKFDRRTRTYKINPYLVPARVKGAAESFRSIARQLHTNIKGTLDATQARLEEIVESLRIDPSKTLARVEGGFAKAAKAVSVAPKLSQASREKIATEYTGNMKSYIKGFAESSIRSLREAVEKNALQGYRFDQLVESFRQRYDVTRSKAEFLARQETSMFMSKYREARFAEGGVRRYKWSTARDERVRNRHRELHGKEFFYNDPPVVSEHGVVPARRGNPGQDFNCRCVDRPVLERREVAA